MGWMRQTMRESAARARRALLPDALDDIAFFLSAAQTADGGYRGRSAMGDVYYSAFAVDCLLALDRPLPLDRLRDFAHGRAAALDLDLPHTASLLRLLALEEEDDVAREQARQRLARFYDPGRGWKLHADSPHSSIYAAFLAALALDDMGLEDEECLPLPSTEALLESLRPDGLFADAGGAAAGTITVTAAAVMLLLIQMQTPPEQTLDALLRLAAPGGGFRLAPNAPAPDLLSTATALTTLAAADVSMPRPLRAACASFVEGAWQQDGGFSSHPADRVSDVEYTWYGLLALGCLDALAETEGPP